jgi:hypothetical protein
LAQSCRLLPGLGVQPHEQPVGRLVQRIQRQPATGVLDRLVEFTMVPVGSGELSQGCG